MQSDYLLKDNRIRKSYRLDEIARRADWDDVSEYHNNVVRQYSDYIEFEAIVSTDIEPNPYKQVRIVEFPGYQKFAKAFPRTIAFSESYGFTADVSKNGLDMPYNIIAHEMAHQWWGKQVTAANVEGDSFIHESFSQYSAMMVMERKYGKAKLRDFLTSEQVSYLKGQSKDTRGENPLVRMAGQKYIQYGKGH